MNPYQRTRRPEFDQPEIVLPELPEPQPWVDMGGDEQPQIDMAPAAGAFKDRFLKGAPQMPTSTPMPHIGGDAPLPGHEAMAGAGEAMKKPGKSL